MMMNDGDDDGDDDDGDDDDGDDDDDDDDKYIRTSLECSYMYL